MTVIDYAFSYHHIYIGLIYIEMRRVYKIKQ